MPMGLWQLASRLARRHSRQVEDKGSIRLVHCNDLVLLLDPSSLVDHAIIASGNWEAEQQSFLLTTVRSLTSEPACPAVFIDIGAYFGLYALRMARSGIFQKVIAIEGDRRNYAQLRANVFINALDRKIDCFEIAVSDRVWHAHFQYSERHPQGNRAGVGITADVIELAEKKTTVPVDDIVSADGSLVVAKVDVEGHELAAIRGMRRLIENNRVLLQVECFDNAIRSHDEFLPTLGLRQIKRIHLDAYWTNIPA
jgi:FkbM family methyltransferase